MDSRGNIYGIPSDTMEAHARAFKALEKQNGPLMPIPPTEIANYSGMNRHDRRAAHAMWRRSQRRAKRAASRVGATP